ncbi:MAG TPA: type II toxin-antitoxin system VapC family toxin [Rhodothermales bacterium]|nr:type II toxin-antitoxin system VapC family toxin [Rhodothermales bacterium]
MLLLLDTHPLLWWLSRPEMLSVEAHAAIEDPSNDVYVSAASAWEIAIKKQLGKIDAPDDLGFQVEASRFVPLPIEIRHALAVADLPPLHRDPFDRVLIVQARLEGMKLISRDEIIPRYGIPTLRA